MASVCQVALLSACLSAAAGSSVERSHIGNYRNQSQDIPSQLQKFQKVFPIGSKNQLVLPADAESIDTANSNKLMFTSCCTISQEIADCTGCNLTFVPSDLPRNITHLLLADNDINNDALYAGVFSKYSQLVALQLDSNNITFLPDDVFAGLVRLKYLSLHSNRISLNIEFNNSTIFSPLNNTLETLIINRNTNDTHGGLLTYPDRSLSVLKHLSRLHIDGLHQKTFGEGFLKLTNLTVLSMAGFADGYCNMTSISNDTFIHLKYLTFLNISDCNLNGSLIHSGAFSPLVRLQVLDVSNNFDLGIQAVGDFMYGLRNNVNFTRLKMQRIVNRFSPCRVIYAHTLRYFKHTGLRLIEAMDNEIEMIEYGALRLLPSTLTIANLTNNRIMFGAYWKDMMLLTGLEKLHLDGYVVPAKFPLFFPSQHLGCPGPEKHSISKNNDLSDKCICGSDQCSADKEEFILPLPPKLQTLTMQTNSLAYQVNNIRFCSNNSLSSIDLSGNVFPHLDGPIVGLSKVRYLNLSSCFLLTISEYFFDYLFSLEHLNLFQNWLGDCLNADENGSIFDTLGNLKYLNLSFNNLYRLNRLAFKNLTNLEILDLSANRLSHISFKASHMRNLQFLDLHKNDISSLSQEIRDLVDSLLKENKSVRIDMRENPIDCDCSNVDFLEWVVRTKVFGNNYTQYYCKYPLLKQIDEPMNDGYEDELARLRRQCSSHVGLFLGVIGSTLVVVALIIGVLMYRFRWTLRYWYHAAKLKIYSNPHQISEAFEYDVFVSYASQDVDFVLQELAPHLGATRRLKLLVHGENFQTGRHIADNIYTAVRQSRKTLVIVTRNNLKSHWCTYELQMAGMESINTGRDVLVFLFLENIPENLMSVSMLSYIQISTYITYPKQAEHRDAFWDKLANDLRAS